MTDLAKRKYLPLDVIDSIALTDQNQHSEMGSPSQTCQSIGLKGNADKMQMCNQD